MPKLHLRAASILTETGLRLKTSGGVHNSRIASVENLNGNRLHFYNAFFSPPPSPSSPKTRNLYRLQCAHLGSERQIGSKLRNLHKLHKSRSIYRIASSACTPRNKKKIRDPSKNMRSKSIAVFPNDRSIFQFAMTNNLISILTIVYIVSRSLFKVNNVLLHIHQI